MKQFVKIIKLFLRSAGYQITSVSAIIVIGVPFLLWNLFNYKKSALSEKDMSDFVNQFSPEGTIRNNAWAKKIFQTWAIK